MKKLVLFLIVFLSVSVAAAKQIQGDYIETRSADVYTGACFANGEVGLVGNEAILGWRVSRGGRNAVALEGLSVVAAVKARATLGDPYNDPYPAKAVLIVDRGATPAERVALAAFAQHKGGRLLENVERVVEAGFSAARVSFRRGRGSVRRRFSRPEAVPRCESGRPRHDRSGERDHGGITSTFR